MDNIIIAGLFGLLAFVGVKAGWFKDLITKNSNLTKSETSTTYTNTLTVADIDPQVSEYDLDIMARTIWGEARSEGYQGMQAVANVIMNRVRSRRWANTPAKVCLQKYQFSVWLGGDASKSAMLAVTESNDLFRQAKEIARRAILNDLTDVTGGADHYLNEIVTIKIRGGSLPSWFDTQKKTASIGRHTFLRLT